MSVQELACHVVRCDICPDYFSFDDVAAHFHTAEAGIAAAIDNDWTDLGNGRLACDRSDAEHDDARDAAAITSTQGANQQQQVGS